MSNTPTLLPQETYLVLSRNGSASSRLHFEWLELAPSPFAFVVWLSWEKQPSVTDNGDYHQWYYYNNMPEGESTEPMDLVNKKPSDRYRAAGAAGWLC